jgi:hypothetical protein
MFLQKYKRSQPNSGIEEQAIDLDLLEIAGSCFWVNHQGNEERNK